MQKEFEDDGGEWKFQKIESLFDIVSGKQPGIQNRFEIKEDGMVNTITGATTRNGVNFYSYSDNSYNNELTISKDGEYAGTVFLQTKPFIIGGHCMGLIAKQSISNLSKVYISTLINKVRPIWRGKDRPSVQKSRLEKLEIELPFKNGEIAFSYMEDYIKALEAERIETLEAYLTVTNLKDYRLTKNDEKILDRFDKLSDTKSRVEEWATYNLVDLFTVKNTHNILSSWITKNSGNTPYLTASQSNNSVSNYISYNEQMLDEGNSIFIGGKTLVISYQEKDYFSNDSHNLALYLKKDKYRTKLIQQFMVVSLYKSLKPQYTWGNSISNSKIQTDTFQLPTKNGQIDYQFMSDFIKVIEKIVIKDLVQWTDKKIAATREVVAK